MIRSFILLFCLIILGQILRKFKARKEVSKTLHFLIIYLTLPALVIATFWKLEYQIASLKVMLIGFLVILSSILISFLISKKLNLTYAQRGSFIITSSHGNTGFLGYPITFYLFGSAGLFYAVFFDLAMFFSLITLISLISSFYGGKGGKIDFSQFKNFLKFPPLFALIIGIILNVFLDQNSLIINSLEKIGSASLPFVILFLGLAIDFKNLAKFTRIIPITAVLKLVLAPLIAFFIIKISNFQFTPIQASVIFLQAGMPSGLLTIVLSRHYQLDTELTSANVFSTTILSLITLVSLFWILKNVIL